MYNIVDHMDEYATLGHQYACDYSLKPSFTWVLTMSPIMATLFSKAEFIEVDATFAASIELEYLLNVVCFDYETLQCKCNTYFVRFNILYMVGAVVARVRMNKLDAVAYKCAFEAIFGHVKAKHLEFSVGKSLKGIVTDWSDTQLKGLQSVIGDDITSQVVKGCQVRNDIKVVKYVCMHNMLSTGALPTLC